MPSIATPNGHANGSTTIADLKQQQQQQSSSSSSGFTVEPLKASGALKKYPRIPLTTALGEQFDKSVRLKEILALPKEEGDEVLRDLAILGEQHFILVTPSKADESMLDEHSIMERCRILQRSKRSRSRRSWKARFEIGRACGKT